MAVVINTVDTNYFTLNGTRYAKIYQPLKGVISAEVAIYNAFDTNLQLIASTPFSEFTVDSLTYGSADLLIDALLPVLYKHVTAGGGAGSIDWGNITGTLSAQLDLNLVLSNKSDIGHTHSFASLTSKPTTIAGYGITDAYTEAEVDSLLSDKADSDITFLQLFDTPVTYTGAEGSSVVVNDNGTGLDFSRFALGAFDYPMRFSTATAPPVAAGRVVLNNADETLVTTIYVSEVDRKGDSIDLPIASLTTGDVFGVAENTGGGAYVYRLTSNATKGVNDYYTFNVEYINSHGTLTNNEAITAVVAYIPIKNFDDLLDVPSYVGNAGKFVAVNATEDGVEYLASSGGAFLPLTGGTLTGNLRIDNGTASTALIITREIAAVDHNAQMTVDGSGLATFLATDGTDTSSVRLSPDGTIFSLLPASGGSHQIITTLGGTLTGDLTINSGGTETLVLQGNGVGIANTVWMSFDDSTGLRRAYLGFPSTLNENLVLANNVTNQQILLEQTGGNNGVRFYDGAATRTIWHSGNDGSGSGLDADTLRGFAPTTANTPSTVVLRDSSSSIYGSSFFAFNPLNGSANASLSWDSDQPRIRIGGSGLGSAGTFEIQGTGNFTRLSLTNAGVLTIPSDFYARAGFYTGDLRVTKNNAWIALDSSSADAVGVEQAAGISIGESGYKGAAAVHMTYTGDGRGWLGMGVVSPTTSKPTYPSLQFQYTTIDWVSGGTITLANNKNINCGSGCAITRTTHNSGYLEGSYNSVANNASQSNPIYVIGSSYVPSTTTLGTMYGVGFCNASASFINSTDLGSSPSGWGLYVATNGTAKVFIDGSNGRGNFLNNVYAANFILNSDRRKKKNIEYINDSDVRGLFNWAKYEYKNEAGLRYGAIANDVEKIYPELVGKDDDGMRSLGYFDLLSLDAAHKDKRITELENKIELLEAKLDLIIKNMT